MRSREAPQRPEFIARSIFVEAPRCSGGVKGMQQISGLMCLLHLPGAPSSVARLEVGRMVPGDLRLSGAGVWGRAVPATVPMAAMGSVGDQADGTQPLAVISVR